MLRNMGNPEGTREACRMSYRKHYRLAVQRSASPDLGSPHAIGLYGLLATRYQARGFPSPEPAVWAELSPFLLMEPQVAVEALAEYVVAQERGPEKARVGWLQQVISEALRKPPTSDDSPRQMAALAVINGVHWCFLLDDDVGRVLEREARELEKRISDAMTP